MQKELEIWQFAAKQLKRGGEVMLLVVTESSGSSPGRQGFKMIVAGDEMRGSIGGGVMEVSLVEQAKVKSKKAKGKSESAIRNPQSAMVEQVHQKNSPHSSGMICSGKQTVIFFKLYPGNLETVHKIIGALEKQEPRKLRITNRELQIDENADADFRFEKLNENEFLFEEKLGYKNKLFIIGGGHCALALSELMSKMDFHISLFDDRADLNTLEKNKFVRRKQIIDSYENIDEFIENGDNHFVVIMTLGYKSDETVIKKLFDKNFKYFGVLGSRAKMKTLLRELEKEGFSKEKLDKIRTPIGLPINSRTPEEIAVSIAAEIIAVKNSETKR